MSDPALPEPASAVPPITASGATALDHTLVKGIAWTGAMKWTSQALTWTSMLVMARLLTPSDYGLVGMATVYLGFVSILTEFGLGASILALQDLTTREIAQLNGVALCMGVVGMTLTCAAAIPLGVFFRAPELPWVVVALSTTFLLSSLKTIPSTLLQKEMRFRALAIYEAGYAVLFATANVVYALLGFRYWALVLGGITAHFISAIAINLFAPHPWAFPRRQELARTLRFSGDVLWSRMAWYVYSNADFAVAGRMLGKSALGAYTFAWSIASMPVEKVTSLVSRVTPSIFSRLQHDNAALRRLLLNVTEGLVFLTLPATMGLAAVAPEFVLVALGNQWQGAIAPLRILALYTTIRSVVTLLPQILLAKHDTAFLRKNGIATACVLPLGFLIGSRWGAAGIALGWVLIYPIFLVPLYRRTFRHLDLSFATYGRAIWPALRGSLIMLLPVLLLQRLMPVDWPLGLRLGIEVGAGVATFLAVAIFPARDRLRRLYQLLRSRRPADPLGQPVTA